jgi:hypothetical protein
LIQDVIQVFVVTNFVAQTFDCFFVFNGGHRWDYMSCIGDDVFSARRLDPADRAN